MPTAITTLADHDREEVTIRLSREQYRLIRQAAGACDLPLASFILASATSNADRVLADHRWRMLAETATSNYQALLDANTSGTPVHRMSGMTLATGNRHL